MRSLGVRGGEDNDHLIDKWPAANSRKINATKVASIVQYENKTENGIEKLEATRWGAQVLASKENCSSLFKPLLEPNFDRDHEPYAFWNSTVGHGGFFLPEAKEPSDVIKDYLDCVWKYSSKTIFRHTRQGPSYHPVHYTITVPGIWARETRKALEQIVKDAGLALKTNDILTMIPEPIAAAVDIFRKKVDTFQVRYGRSHCYDLGNDS